MHGHEIQLADRGFRNELKVSLSEFIQFCSRLFLWNHFDTGDGARTVNHLEGCDATLNKAVGIDQSQTFLF